MTGALPEEKLSDLSAYWRSNGSFIRLLHYLVPLAALGSIKYIKAGRIAVGGDPESVYFSYLGAGALFSAWLLVLTWRCAGWLRKKGDVAARWVHPAWWTAALLVPYLNLAVIALLLWRLALLVKSEYRPVR